MKYLIIPLIFLLAACDDQATTSTEESKTSPPSWNTTQDLTRSNPSVTTYIITDPQGQKFLVFTRSSAISVIPYKELTLTPESPK